MVRQLAVRASSRPKKISTRGRATWVERMRSLGSWKLPTLSEREWRSATEAALGANGSCTWTMSSSTPPSSSSSGRLRSIGTGAARGAGPRGIARLEPTASTGGPPSPPALSPFQEPSNSAAGRSRAARITRRDSRTADREAAGAATTTLCPRSARPAETRATNSLTSCGAPHGWGLTWAIERRSGATGAG